MTWLQIISAICLMYNSSNGTVSSHVYHNFHDTSSYTWHIQTNPHPVVDRHCLHKHNDNMHVVSYLRSP